MRIWSIHPKYLDSKGLVALWRESLLARNVLEGKTKGYKNHPQLDRFKSSDDPILFIHSYLQSIWEESIIRGFKFDSSKFHSVKLNKTYPVTEGQINYEFEHLQKKLLIRDPDRYIDNNKTERVILNRNFYLIKGGIEPWEIF